MIEELKSRFGADAISSFKKVDENLELIQITIRQTSPITILMTQGLSNYDMPVHEKFKGRENMELYFCLPSYWDAAEKENPNRNWPALWLEKLAKHVISSKAWYGPGHTIGSKNDEPLSEMIRQSQLMILDPLLLNEELKPMEIKSKTIYFMAVMPIFFDELEFKQAKGTNKLVEKFNSKNITEKLDDFRETVIRSRWKLWK